MAVMESAGTIGVVVKREGAMDSTVSVYYKCREGTATKDADYIHEEGILTFKPGEQEQTISVKIVDDVAYEDDEEFYIDLSDCKIADATAKDREAILGQTATMTVVIIDDDFPGYFRFVNEQLHVQEQTKDFSCDVMIERKGGCNGKVSVNYKTEDGSAKADIDFEAMSGTLEFENQETQKMIKIAIKARGRYDRKEIFRVILSEPTGGAKIDPETDGGEECCYLTVCIEGDTEGRNQVDRIMSSLQANWDKAKVGHANWCDQFKAAIHVLGGEEDDNDEDEPVKPGVGDYVMHVISLPWKLLFACCPPTDYFGGWLCFCVSLSMIGLVTAIIGDVAALFGCCLGWPDEITAISVVALGTSLPDTFASKTAAMQDPYADASVGNVTGSNSVNVFLGLGLPWMIGAIYWLAKGADSKWNSKYLLDPDVPSAFKEGVFVVKAGNLAFSVMIFTTCAIACIVSLLVRRRVYGGELGGPPKSKWAHAAGLVGLWLFYVSMSSWYTIQNM
eukprot:TRINITY_DN13680_c2_g1_i2.p1 TRINITY_DN13680_c2_g1~~TRINITY_DN13680_c2_g1_i2.p1  ORF type:complete len:571 (+),score=111.82 TRINITY_DN13680_c2_g1_i2:201-1715(+)